MVMQSDDQVIITILSIHDNVPTLNPIGNMFFKEPIGIFSYVHCNGVFCLHDCMEDQDDLILWREVQLLPQPSYNIVVDEDEEAFIGFGADPNTNEFKVVKVSIHCPLRCSRSSSFSLAELYNHSTKSWTIIPLHVPPSETIIYHGHRHFNMYNTLVNGVYHWLIGPNYDDHDFNILCFDFHTNQFQLLESPVRYSPIHHDIAEINGSLAYVNKIFDRFDSIYEIRIWVKDQQGWVKKYNINVSLDCRLDIERVLSKGKDDVQVLDRKFQQDLMKIYDKDCNLLHQFKCNLTSDSWIHEYVQSIVPLST
ncbi:putative F-box protein At3g23260 [Medicago truncatula]|nr:putative F-box protein At3g23260 [Medicago truncatula]